MKRIVWLTISRETSGLYLERQEDCFFFVDFNLISQVSVRFFLVCDDDEILDYYIVKVVTIACEFRISINTTTVTFFYFLRFFFVISLKIIEIHGKIISFAYRGGLM